MTFELRISGHPPTRFEDEHALYEAAVVALRTDRTARIEMFDLATGRPLVPTDRRNWHEEYKKRLGY